MSATNRKPNVLFICVDQMRADTLGCLGDRGVETPHIDQLAADGVAFSQYYSVSSPCCPARTSLLTGLYPAEHGSITKAHLYKAEHNLASTLAEQNIEPVLFGFTDTVISEYLHEKEGIMPGFKLNTYMNLHPSGLRAWMDDLRQKGYQVPDNPLDIYKGTVAPYLAKDSDSAFLTERVLDYIDAEHQQPWFAHVVYFRPHPPFIAPAPYDQMYQDHDVCIDNPELNPFLNAHPMHQKMFDSSYHKALLKDKTHLTTVLSDKISADTRTYYGLISELDQQIGRIFARLKAKGEYDNTLIIFTSDHGEMLGDNWLYNKGGHFDSSYHVPLVIKPHSSLYPNQLAAQLIKGRVCDQFVESIDLKPTILEALQVDIPMQCQGWSFKCLLEADFDSSVENYEHRSGVTFEYYYSDKHSSRVSKMLAIKDHHYKYVYYEDMPDLFFDLQSDPKQQHNLIDEPAIAQEICNYKLRLAGR